MPHHEIAGKIIIEAMIVSIGVSIGTAQLGGSEGKQESDSDSQDQDSKSSEQRPHVLGQLILAYCGATIFAANIAPTEEIVIVAIESKPWKLIGLAVLSILIGALILQYSSFIGAEQTWSSGGAFFKLLEPVASYAAALLASAMMLWHFRRFDDVSLATCISETVVLGFAGNIGAAAGRLLIQ